MFSTNRCDFRLQVTLPVHAAVYVAFRFLIIDFKNIRCKNYTSTVPSLPSFLCFVTARGHSHVCLAYCGATKSSYHMVLHVKRSH